MGLRYRKSIKLMPGVKLNLSRSGISTSIGKRGATVNFSKRGTRATVGIPGSGLSYSSMVGKRKSRARTRRASSKDVVAEARATMLSYGLTERETDRFIKEAKKHPKRFIGKSDEEIVAYCKRHRLSPNLKIFLLILLLLLLVYEFFVYSGK